MPVHNWSSVDAGIFHAFHHEWISAISRALNRGLLSSEFYALPEQYAGGYGPDVLTLQTPSRGKGIPNRGDSTSRATGTDVLESPPKTRFHVTSAPAWYATKKKSVAVHHISNRRVVAIVEIVSLGNKASRSGLASFTRKAHDGLSAGVHLSVIDLFPPGVRDPEGIHPLIWGDDATHSFQFDATKPLTCGAYVGGPSAEAYVDTLAVGDCLNDLPVFLTPLEYVSLPLEETYLAAFDSLPDFWRDELNR